jgi:hypothetical protein
MISPDLHFEGFDSTSWTNLISLFAPGVRDRIGADAPATDSPEIGRTISSAPDPTPTGTIVIVESHGGDVLKALHSARGRIRDLDYKGPDDLERIREDYGARQAIVLREGVLEELTERLALRLSKGDDYLTQVLQLLRAFRELEDAGLILIHPNPVANIPVPSNATVARALDIILPDDHAFVAVLWRRREPWTAVALRRRNGMIDYVAGPDLISQWTGPLGGDFRRDYRIIARAVAEHMAPVHVGIYSEVRTMQQLLRDPDPGAWASHVATRDVILHPAPPYAAVALSADAIRAAASTSARILGGIDLFGIVKPLTEYVRGRVSELSSVTDTLGFNPLTVLAAALSRSDSDRSDTDSFE